MKQLWIMLWIPWLLGWQTAAISNTTESTPPIKVVVSIKPLALLASEVVGNDGVVETLVSSNASPHHYAMRVSDMRRLGQAQLIIWVGPQLERFLVRPLASLDPNGQLELAQLEALEWPSQQVVHKKHNSRHHSELHGGKDPHIWLNPHNGVVIVTAIAQRLGQLHPDKAENFKRRALQLTQQLKQRNIQLQEQFAPLRDKGFAVYHDGYGHFVQTYGLQQLAAVAVGVERKPGARHLYQIRQRLSSNTHCLLSAPAYSNKLAKDLAADLKVPLITLDPLGRKESNYIGLLNHMADAFYRCLSATR